MAQKALPPPWPIGISGYREASVRSYVTDDCMVISAVTTSTSEADAAWTELHATSPDRARQLAQFLRDFYATDGRHDLPWRRSSNPYEIVVAELMLQKTHHRAVPSALGEFLRRWPRVEDLRGARLRTIERILSPLGLPRRARQLKELAIVVCDRGGLFPSTKSELLALPGIGPYTAGAVLSQCFGSQVPMIDVNAARIYCRAYGFNPRTLRQALRFAECAAREVIKRTDARTANLAVLDFAHAVCRVDPLCNECALRVACQSRREHPTV